MSIPAFNKMGSKARIRKWLVGIFPSKGNKYVEVFCGNANVFFYAVNKLNYNRYILNDKYSYKFLLALKEINIRQLPISIDTNLIRFKQCLSQGKTLNLSPTELVVESLITFGGKGYKSGLGDVNRYKRDKLITRINEAKCLLKMGEIYNYDWEDIEYEQFTKEDFLYFDPPYFETKASYPNINHMTLICDILPILKCKWALSGYDNWLYKDCLEYKNKYQINRSSEIKGSVNGGKSEVTETLWTNF